MCTFKPKQSRSTSRFLFVIASLLAMLTVYERMVYAAQPRVLDSLLRRLPADRSQHTSDTSLTNLLNDITYQYWQSNLDSARRYATEAQQLAEQQGYARGLGVTLENFGRIAMTQGHYDSAMAFHAAALRIFEKIGWNGGRVSALTGKGVTYRLQGKYGESLAEYKSALQILHSDSLYTRTNSSEQKAFTRILNNIAMVYRLQGRYGEALPYLLQALKIRQQVGDPMSVAALQRNIGLLFDAQRRYEQAFRWYAEALATSTALADKQGIASVQDNLGMVYFQTGALDSAEMNHQSALRLFEEIGNVPGKASALYNLARVAMARSDVRRAEDLHRRALELRQKTGDKEAIASSLVGVAQTQVARGRHYEAITYFEYAAALADSLGAKSVAEEAYTGLVEEYDRTAQPLQALTASKRLLVLRDTLFAERNFRALAELQAQHQNEQQSQRIRLLEGEQQLQAMKLEREATLRNYALGLVGMAIFLAVLAIYGYQVKRNSANKLQQQNTEILKQQHLLEQQAVDIQVANTALHEKNIALESQQTILEEQAREIEMANTALHEQNTALEHLSNEKNEFMGIAAHDLKNPLAQIIMASDATVRYYSRMSDDEIRAHLSRIGIVAKHMTEIICNLLDVNAIESGATSLHLVVLNGSLVLDGLVQEYLPRAERKNMSIHAEIPPNVAVYADERALTQIIDNLISNAIKYSPHGRNIVVRMYSQSEAVRIAVSDEGPGLSGEDKAKLFGKFARLSAQPTGGEHSTGLGLSIVKKMVEAMNGRVWCESELGKGATFIVELPAAG